MQNRYFYDRFREKMSVFDDIRDAREDLRSRDYDEGAGQLWTRGKDRAFLVPIKTQERLNGTMKTVIRYLVTWGEFAPEMPQRKLTVVD